MGVKTLKGIGVNSSKGTGRVIKVGSAKDFSKVKGDNLILVTTNATPDFILILKKIKCIITDQGGVTSHIAIICRELNVPAIVGVGDASSVLKNGQKAYFNSKKGIIRY